MVQKCQGTWRAETALQRRGCSHGPGGEQEFVRQKWGGGIWSRGNGLHRSLKMGRLKVWDMARSHSAYREMGRGVGAEGKGQMIGDFGFYPSDD